MPVPRQRLSSRRGRMRASHHALHAVTTITCAQCQKAILPHRACPWCGFYKGRNLKASTPKTPVLTTVAKPVAPSTKT